MEPRLTIACGKDHSHALLPEKSLLTEEVPGYMFNSMWIHVTEYIIHDNDLMPCVDSSSQRLFGIR